MKKVIEKAVAVIQTLFSPMVHAEAKDTFKSTVDTENKWAKLGGLVAAEIANAKALDKVRPQVLRELVYQNMPDVSVSGSTYSALAVVDYAIPRKGTESYNNATQAERELWAAMQAASASVRGAGSTFYGRIRKYAERTWNPKKAETDAKKAAAAKKKAAKAKPSQKVITAIGTLLAMIQKMDKPDFAVKAVADNLEAAQKAAAAGLPKTTKPTK